MLINTKILLVNPENPEKNVVHEAARILKGGGIVSFPTETVYALGADAYNQAMVAKIYRIKRRDRSKPLSVFLRDAKDARKVVDSVSKDAAKLMEKFWPRTADFSIQMHLSQALTGFGQRGQIGHTSFPQQADRPDLGCLSGSCHCHQRQHLREEKLCSGR